jgi:hypothetical protein
MYGATPTLPQYVFMAWYLVKHKDYFTFTFSFKVINKLSGLFQDTVKFNAYCHASCRHTCEKLININYDVTYTLFSSI